ncbi:MULTISPECIES: ArsR/SmtB family transcription factor [Rhizobium]|uniref:Helix-turn-helix transcriptional regulator n=1 Tax=Rhizobium rhododendri TaxID=2506430 RepID=A0ABY8IP05_9HYPH|nr:MULTISPECIES: helix-turn-helix transcriptional regulator [Rhizobium]WFS24873.1 helix-turn-helix transcriptional regulator [Rhizobium rhododendri]
MSSSSATIELRDDGRYHGPMAKEIYHPTIEQIDLSTVLDAMSDPTRRDIVLRLVELGEGNCSGFSEFGSKTNLTYHYARLREAGITSTRVEGTQRIISLRLDDLETKFPGLMTAILSAALRSKFRA